MVDFHCLAAAHLEQFLLRRRAHERFPSDMSLADNLVEILRKANEFVPSAAGSILLDNPGQKQSDRRKNLLTFIAAFGEKAEGLVGKKIPGCHGIAGHVYASGSAYYTGDVSGDSFFYAGVDEMTQYRTRSLVAIPIRIEKEVCGVLELVNRQDATEYSPRDRDLLEIFAGYISVSIQNVLDARTAHELARRDNLTGLYNDRYLHIGLQRAIDRCRQEGRDLVVLFLDLDYFKLVNDNHGHLAGSQVLHEVGTLLRHCLPNRQAFPARYGGDEFVLVLPGMRLDEGVDLAETIRVRISRTAFCTKPGEIQNEPLHLRGLTCSIGVASYLRHIPRDIPPEQTRSALLRLSDTAMYVAKETGRNRTATASEPVLQRRPPAPRD